MMSHVYAIYGKVSRVYPKLMDWCRGQGLNMRQLGLQPSALPG
jgi:hypothetical protein